MHLIFREPITINCGRVFNNHIRYSLHSMSVDYYTQRDGEFIINPSVWTGEGANVDKLLDLITQHSASARSLTLLRENSGYYVVQIQYD